MSARRGRRRTSIVEWSQPSARKGVSPTRFSARTRKISPPLISSPPIESPPPLNSLSPPNSLPPLKSPPAARSARKSPSRKSPSRKPGSKSPARKSPPRTPKETTEIVAQKRPAKRFITKSEVAVRLEDVSRKLETFRGTRSKRFEYSIKELAGITKSEFAMNEINGLETISNELYGLRNRKAVEEVMLRRSSRLREFIDNIPDIKSSVSKSISHSDSVSKSLETYSDEESADEILLRKSKSVTRKLSTPIRNTISDITQIVNRWEFGGRIGSVLLMLLIPLTVLTILISCTKSCSVVTLSNLTAFKTAKAWFNLQTLGYIALQILTQAVFALIPIFGTESDRMDETGQKYCFNAFFSSIFTITMLHILDFYQIINKDALSNEYMRLAVISYIFAVILSIILYMRNVKNDHYGINPYGNTGYGFYDFFMGKEVHPHIKKLDIKIWISRITNINTLILSMLIFTKGLCLQLNENESLSLENYKEFLNKVQLKPTILLFSMMQITYILNFIMREYKITTTFYWHSEGLGYLQIVSSTLYPFYFTTITKYVADIELSLSTNILLCASVLYALGFFVMLISNNIKYEFRKNPLHPSLANLDSMPTFHGKKLLVSSLWGVVRHPNYAGDILIHIVLALPGILTRQFMAAAPALLTIVVLLHRSWRDHHRCKRRYGAAWQRYCKKVPSVIIPKVL